MNYVDIIDRSVFLFLNKYLLNSSTIQYLFGFLVHKNESWINVIVMVLINIIALFSLPKEKRIKAFGIILYCWLSFQVVLLANNLIFHKIFSINRNSPSVVLTETIKLSKVLNNPNLKDYSHNSFPAGHALVLVYWLLFINLYATKKSKIIAVLVVMLLAISRMVTGAHWFSDTIFSVLLAWGSFKLSLWIANKNDRIKYCLH